MRLIALISATLSIDFSAEALAMSYPVYVDETCRTMVEARSTPALKAWIKRQCPQGEASDATICKDFAPFIRDVAGNNENWRRKCATPKP
ncbi:hypothetical protein [Methylocystis sp. S23]